MNSASLSSLIVFAPVLLAFLLPATLLLPAGVLFTLIAISDPTVPLSSATSYGMWIIAPMGGAACLFLIGRGLFSRYRRGLSPRVTWIAAWVIFSAALFLAAWFGVTVIASVGASDKPLGVFLSWTALAAGGLTGLAQAFVAPWLFLVSKKLIEPSPLEPSITDKSVLEQS